MADNPKTAANKTLPTNLTSDVNTIDKFRTRLRGLETHFGLSEGQLCWNIGDPVLISALTNGSTMMGGGSTVGIVWSSIGHNNMVLAAAASIDPDEIFDSVLTNLYTALPQYVNQYGGTGARRQAA